jgi:arsenate reductase-like glutaredoxin family protein
VCRTFNDTRTDIVPSVNCDTFNLARKAFRELESTEAVRASHAQGFTNGELESLVQNLGEENDYEEDAVTSRTLTLKRMPLAFKRTEEGLYILA